MESTSTTAFVTGANRGLGRAFVEALLDRGAPRVYATARDVTTLEDLVASASHRVVPVELDLTRVDQIDAAADRAADVDLLINNAGTAAFAPLLEASHTDVEMEMATNFFGTLNVVRAFAPVIERNGGGAIVNLLTLVALASTPAMAGYSASKAAAHSLTQSLRASLAGSGTSVHGVYPGAVDTDMIARIEMPKTPPRAVADTVLDGVRDGVEDIFPDPMAEQMASLWKVDPKAFEQRFAALAV